ncbi:MAG: hypothetical protein R3B94_00795 [Hyphomonas sp.]
MSSYFEQTASTMRATALRRADASANEVLAQFSMGGRVSSGAFWRALEKKLADELRQFANELQVRLEQFDVEHAPIKKADFSLAKQQIHEFEAGLRGIFQRHAERQGDRYPASYQPFGDGDLANAVRQAELNIEGYESVFKSKRSFWKWAFGDARRVVFTIIVGTVANVGVQAFKLLWEAVALAIK